jgi:peptidoglycan/LPS O-acetylase OafA/YrhL
VHSRELVDVTGVPTQASLFDRPPKLPSLTGLRFFAALLVFGFHVTLSISPIPPYDPINPFADERIAAAAEEAFAATGFIGVSFFFVLSGFLLAWSAKPGERVGHFWRRRIVKIFPNHVVTWLVSMVLFAAAVTPAGAAVLSLFLVHTYSWDDSINEAVNAPAWSLGSELLFYALFPLLIVGVRRIRGSRLWLWAGVMLLGMVAVQIINLSFLPDSPQSFLAPTSSFRFWFGYLFPPPRLFEFVLGSVVARLVRERRWPAFRMRHALVACALGYGVSTQVPFVWTFNVATIVPVTMLIATAAAHDAGGRASMLHARPLQWLGNISFGFYLCQGVTIFWVRHAIGPATFSTPVALAVVAGILALTLLGGWALYALVEKPMMDRFGRPRRAPIRAVEPAVGAVEVRPAPAGRGEGTAAQTPSSISRSTDRAVLPGAAE